MPVAKQDVGGRLYVFSTNGGMLANTGCVIDAHGEQLLFGNTREVEFTVPPATNLHFYSPHGSKIGFHRGRMRFGATFGADVRDYHFTTSLEAIMLGTAAQVEAKLAGAQCPDYELSKIQRAGDGLTGGRWTNFMGQRHDMSYDDVVKFMQNGGRAVKDLVTIRYRRLKSDITLSEAITLLINNGYNYSDIHCCFCRSPKWIGSVPPVHL